jgi:anti-sigma factor (TIGR02949 family)
MSASDQYDCHEAFRRLDDFVDRELPPEQMERVQAHLEICAICAAEVRFESTVLDELRGKLRRISVPTGLMDRISARIASARGAEEPGG